MWLLLRCSLHAVQAMGTGGHGNRAVRRSRARIRHRPPLRRAG